MEMIIDSEAASAKRPGGDMASLQRKKFKTAELPLTAVQRASIDNLLYTFKKKGGFDSLRKNVWASYSESEAKNTFTTALNDLAESEIDREPSLLSRDRGKAATLIEGAVDRSDIYKTVEADIDSLIAKHLDHVLDSVREIRKQDVGDEAAAEEERTGNKTDEDYERDTEVRRQERERMRFRTLELEKQIEKEKKKIRAEELRKQREAERRREEEEKAKELEREEKRRAEREKAREEQRLLDEQRDREREERHERRRREEKERMRERELAESHSRHATTRRDYSDTPKERTPQVPPVDEKSLEAAALELLLKEGKELAAKSKQKPEFDFEQAEALETSTRKAPSQRTRPNEDQKYSSSRVERVDSSSRRHHGDGSPSSQVRDRHKRDETTDSQDRGHVPAGSRSRSRDRHTSRYDDDKRKADKEAWKQEAARQREKEAEAYKRAVREGREKGGVTGGSHHRSESKSTMITEKEDRRSSHRREHSKSRSPPRRRRERSWTRSPPPKRSHRDRSRTPPRRRRSRSPVDIDRYVPGGGRDRSRSPRRRRARSGEREERERHRYTDIDRYVPPSK